MLRFFAIWLRVPVAAALAVLCTAAPAQRISLVDRIVAVVNTEVIPLSELNEAVAAAARQLRRQGTAPPPREILERQMLERLILDKAQLQLARDTGIRVDELQVDRAVQRIAEQNNLTLAQLRAALERDGVSFEAWRKDLRDQIILSRVREREVDDRIQVTDTEIALFLEESKSRPEERNEYNLAHILVREPEQASPELIEAARVEGANRFQVARHVIVPQLRGATIIVAVVFVIYALRTFDVV
ncbi:MAG: SurA N-terminal domain-containing protein, partial [Betaproteobacteria bacterium]